MIERRPEFDYKARQCYSLEDICSHLKTINQTLFILAEVYVKMSTKIGIEKENILINRLEKLKEKTGIK